MYTLFVTFLKTEENKSIKSEICTPGIFNHKSMQSTAAFFTSAVDSLLINTEFVICTISLKKKFKIIYILLF